MTCSPRAFRCRRPCTIFPQTTVPTLRRRQHTSQPSGFRACPTASHCTHNPTGLAPIGAPMYWTHAPHHSLSLPPRTRTRPRSHTSTFAHTYAIVNTRSQRSQPRPLHACRPSRPATPRQRCRINASPATAPSASRLPPQYRPACFDSSTHCIDAFNSFALIVIPCSVALALVPRHANEPQLRAVRQLASPFHSREYRSRKLPRCGCRCKCSGRRSVAYAESTCAYAPQPAGYGGHEHARPQRLDAHAG